MSSTFNGLFIIGDWWWGQSLCITEQRRCWVKALQWVSKGEVEIGWPVSKHHGFPVLAPLNEHGLSKLFRHPCLWTFVIDITVSFPPRCDCPYLPSGHMSQDQQIRHNDAWPRPTQGTRRWGWENTVTRNRGAWRSDMYLCVLGTGKEEVEEKRMAWKEERTNGHISSVKNKQECSSIRFAWLSKEPRELGSL